MTAPPAPRGRRAIELLIEVPAVIVAFVMMLHITANALLRYFANSPIPNTLEYVQYWYMPIVALLGFVAAQLRGQHIAADLVFRVLPRAVKPYVAAVGCAASALMAAGFAWYGWGEAVHAWEIKMTAGVSTLLSWPVYFLVPLAFASLTAQFAWAAVQAFRKPDADDAGTPPSADEPASV